jgi:hypothetical protein
MLRAALTDGRKQTMIGISTELADDLAKRGYSREYILKLFGPKAHHGEARVHYDRGNGDLTSPMPSSRHMTYVSRGWIAAKLATDAPLVKPEPVEVPAEIAEHARHDRVGIWRRGNDEIELSCRNALNLLSKGYAFVGLADEERRRASVEARLVPSKTKAK